MVKLPYGENDRKPQAQSLVDRRIRRWRILRDIERRLTFQDYPLFQATQFADCKEERFRYIRQSMTSATFRDCGLSGTSCN